MGRKQQIKMAGKEGGCGKEEEEKEEDINR